MKLLEHVDKFQSMADAIPESSRKKGFFPLVRNFSYVGLGAIQKVGGNNLAPFITESTLQPAESTMVDCYWDSGGTVHNDMYLKSDDIGLKFSNNATPASDTFFAGLSGTIQSATIQLHTGPLGSFTGTMYLNSADFTEATASAPAYHAGDSSYGSVPIVTSAADTTYIFDVPTSWIDYLIATDAGAAGTNYGVQIVGDGQTGYFDSSGNYTRKYEDTFGTLDGDWVQTTDASSGTPAYEPLGNLLGDYGVGSKTGYDHTKGQSRLKRNKEGYTLDKTFSVEGDLSFQTRGVDHTSELAISIGSADIALGTSYSIVPVATSGATVVFQQSTGASVTNTVKVYGNATAGDSASFSFSADRDKFKIEASTSSIKVKLWTKDEEEPTTWDINDTITTTSSGDYLQITTVNQMVDPSFGNVYVQTYIDNLIVSDSTSVVTNRPKISVLAATADSGEQLNTHKYKDNEGVEYAIRTNHDLGSIYDSIQYLNGSNTWVDIRVDLTKGKKYTFADHNGRCYVANGADPLWWFDSSFTTYAATKNDVVGAPISQYIAASKNRLFAADTINYRLVSTSNVTSDADLVRGTAIDLGTVAITTDGTPEHLSNTASGDEFAEVYYDVTNEVNIVLGATTIQVEDVDITNYVAAGDYVSLVTYGLKNWYLVSSATFSTHTTINITTKFKEASVTDDTEGLVIYGGNGGTMSSPNFTTAFYKIEKVHSDNILYVRGTDATFEENAAQKYLVRRKVKNVLHWSAHEMTDDWDVPGTLGGDDSGWQKFEDPITGLHDIGTALLAFTSIGNRALIGTSPGDWFLSDKSHSDIGCDSHWSIISKDNFLGFWSKKNGYYVLKGSQVADFNKHYNLPTLYSESYTALIPNYVADIDKDLADYVTAAIYKDWLLISVPNSTKHGSTDVTTDTEYTTGTVAITNASATVTGTTTTWLGVVRAGDHFKIDADGTEYVVSSVTSDTVLVLTEVYAGTTIASGGVYTVTKRRNNDLLMLDTRVNLEAVASFGWATLGEYYCNQFTNYDNKLYYGSSINGLTYEFDSGTSMYGASFDALLQVYSDSSRIKKDYADLEKIYSKLSITAKGSDVLKIEYWFDGDRDNSTTIQHTFPGKDKDNNSYSATSMQTVEFPNYQSTDGDQWFGGKGSNIKMEITSSGTGSMYIKDIKLYGDIIEKY